jgi:hypothetical protein
MKELHERPLGMHFATKITQRKILDVRYWWPTVYKDVHDYCKSCDACQRTRGLETQSFAKLNISLLEEPFMKWGFDFVRSTKPIRRYARNKSILVTTDYVINWVEVKNIEN